MSVDAASTERVGSEHRRRAASLVATPARAAVCVGVIGLAAFLAHVAMVSAYKGPWIFDDELGYQKLAQSLAETGHFALFGKQGLTYSPLYPVILAPLYRLHLNGTQVYEWSKVVNCLLMAASVLPVYKIARFVLAPGRAVVGGARAGVGPPRV
jgi:hypothetical protein